MPALQYTRTLQLGAVPGVQNILVPLIPVAVTSRSVQKTLVVSRSMRTACHKDIHERRRSKSSGGGRSVAVQVTAARAAKVMSVQVTRCSKEDLSQQHYWRLHSAGLENDRATTISSGLYCIS